MQPRKPERLESGHGCSSTKLKRSASLPMIHFCFFQSYLGSGLLARWGSTPTPLAITRPISWHLLRNKGPRFRLWSGSAHGRFLAVFGGHRGSPSALQSVARALRSCRALTAGDAVRARCPGVGLVLALVGAVVAWISRISACGRALLTQRGAGDRESRYLDVCFSGRI